MSRTLPLSQWLSTDRPDDTLVAWQGAQQWTLGHLRGDVAQLQAQLQAHPGRRWALCVENGYLFLVALLAMLHSGKTPIIPGHQRPAWLEEQRDHLDGAVSETSVAFSKTVVTVHSGKHAAHPLPPVDPQATLELYTSGSTGMPQRVVKPVSLLDAEAALVAGRFAARIDGCRVVSSVTPQHLYGLTFRLFMPMALGLPLHAAMLQFPEQLAALDPTHTYAFISSPAFLKRLDPALTPPPLAFLLSAGGAFAWPDVKHTAAWCNVWADEIYGSTETGVIAWRQRTDNSTAWQLFPDVILRAEGDGWRVLSPLIAGSDGLPLADRLEFVSDGFRLAGRRDRIIKIEEKRVSLSDVEQRLCALEGIRDAAVVPLLHRSRQTTGAVLVLDATTQAKWRQHPGETERQWRQALRRWLEPVAIPRCWRIVEAIPVNSMNKRVYDALQELFNDAP